jgi:hypothetical protein
MAKLATQSTWRIKPRWHDFSFAMKAINIAAILSWSTFAGSLWTVGYIETAALTQPSHPDLVFSHPHEIKSGIRFFTDRQEQIYTIVKPTMIVAFGITAILFFASNRLNDRLEQERKKNVMDKIAIDFEKQS